MIKRSVHQLCCVIASTFFLSLACGNAVSADEAADPNRPIKDKWAVIIGIGKFSDPSIPQLKFPAKDAQDLRDFLVKKGNFAPDHVLLLKDEQASREHILDAFGDGWLPRRVMEDDLVVIFISSHGSAADRAGENFIIAYDSNPAHPYSTSIRLQDLANEVTRRTGCDRLVLLLDACHSGAAIDAGAKGLTRSQSNFDVNAITGSGQLVISSSKPDQVSWESKRYPNGVFTHNLIDALQVHGSDTKIDSAYSELKKNVETEVRFDRAEGQSPMMMSKWKGNELALCALPAEPRKIPFAQDDMTETTQTSGTQTKKTQASSTSISSTNSSSSKNNGSATASNSTKPVSKPAVDKIASSKPPAALGGGKTFPVWMNSSWQNDGGDPSLEKGSRMLDSSELSGLNYQQLENMYNEPYARHGRGFLSPRLQSYFNSQSWYAIDPTYHWKSDDPYVIAHHGRIDDSLVLNEKRTPIQWANMKLIKSVMGTAPR